MKSLGKHLISEFFECNDVKLKDLNYIKTIMLKSQIASGATIIDSNFHNFSPFGVSGIIIISESHLSIHTWPEYKFVQIDIFTCGTNADPWVALEILRTELEQKKIMINEIERGKFEEIGIQDNYPFKPNQ